MNLVRFAAIDWNDGMLKYWNVGFGKLEEWGCQPGLTLAIVTV